MVCCCARPGPGRCGCAATAASGPATKRSAGRALQVLAGPQGDGWVQDEDTLDSWFSSALWTWSTLIDLELAADPEVDLSALLAGSADFERFHPTSVMETGDSGDR